MRRTRIRPIGKKKERWAAHQAVARTAVINRARGICEAPGCFNRGVDRAHAFSSKGHIVGEPLTSMPCMCFWLCRPCHERMDQRDPEFQEEMRWHAIAEAVKVLGPFPDDVSLELLRRTPEGAARLIEEWWRPPGDLSIYYH